MEWRGTLSRRQLIRGAGSASVAMAAGARPTWAAALAPWTPWAGLRLAGPVQGVASLDPALSRDLETNFLVRQICRGLMGYDRHLNPVPELAGAVDVSADGQTYTFTLRPEARFHDGRPVEPADVVASLSRALNPATAGGDASTLPGVVYLRDIVGTDDVLAGRTPTLAGVEAADAATVRISLQAPSATFLMRLAAVPASIVDGRQKKDDPQWWAHLNGTGPFRVASVDPQALLALEPVEGGRMGGVRIRLGASAALPVNLFQAGEIDLVPDLHPQLVALVEDPATGVDDSVLLETPQFGIAYIALGNQRPPLDDVHVRRALQRVFPADRLARAMFGDRVLPATGLLPPGMLGRDWPADLPVVDVDAAHAEIAVSRYGRPEAVPPIRVYAADMGPVEALRDVAASELGLRVEAIQASWYDLLEGLVGRRWDAYAMLWGADYPDPEALLWMLFGSDSGENYTRYTNPAFDLLLAEARAERDAGSRADRYALAQQMLIDDAAVIPLYVPIGYALARAGLEAVPVTPMGLLGLETIS